MGRQSAGLGLVIVALVAAMLVPTMVGRETVGRAVALPIPAAPRVGDCLLDNPQNPVLNPTAGAGPLSVPCSSAHDGEVITQTATVVGVATSRMGGGEVPDVATCANTAYWYLGVHPLDAAGDRSTALGPWWPAFSADFSARRPTAFQLRIGQAWVACVMISPHGSMTGSAAHLFGGPPRFNPMALCIPNRKIVLEVAVSCDQPHPAEILGWRATDAERAPASLVQSCAVLSRRITGMTDPTADGGLRSAVDIMRSADGPVRQGWGPGHGRAYQAACTISPATGRLLSGSLTGLGSAPVPWA